MKTVPKSKKKIRAWLSGEEPTSFFSMARSQFWKKVTM